MNISPDRNSLSLWRRNPNQSICMNPLFFINSKWASLSLSRPGTTYPQSLRMHTFHGVCLIVWRHRKLWSCNFVIYQGKHLALCLKEHFSLTGKCPCSTCFTWLCAHSVPQAKSSSSKPTPAPIKVDGSCVLTRSQPSLPKCNYCRAGSKRCSVRVLGKVRQSWQPRPEETTNALQPHTRRAKAPSCP